MKKISIFLFAVAALLGVSCEDSSDADKVIPVSAIALDASLSGGITMEIGQTRNIAGKVTVLPEDASNKTESYESSDTKIVTVDESGVMKAVEPGLAMVTISVGGKHTHFEVNVEAQKIPVETVTLPAELADGVTLKVGEKLTIAGKVTISPSNATNTEESYESSVPMIASVSEDGVVTAIAVGETTITVTVDGKSARFSLKVEKVAVETVTLPEELTKGVTLEVGETLTIAGKATVKPENATFKTESYDSSDKSVATVSAEGVVTALKIGKTTISVTIDGVKASFELTGSQHIPVTGLALPAEWNDGISLEIEKTLDIAGKVIITPENATNRTETYDSSDKTVATISAEGVVTALKAGETTITITVDSKTITVKLTVTAKPVALEKIEIKNGANATQGAATVVLGQTNTFDLYAQLNLTPADQNEGVKYVSYGSEDIATIDEDGKVTCKGVGTVTFVILAKGNTNNDFKNAGAKKAYFAVNITDPKDLDRTGWEISKASGKIKGTGNSPATNPFDSTFDPGVFGAPIGTTFSMTRPGKTDNGETVAANAQIWFVVDMQAEKSVNYFRIMHQSIRNTDRGCRWKKFVEILGSNDGVNFTQIVTNIDVPNLDYAMAIDPNDGGTRNLDNYQTCSNIKLPGMVKYRYLKFVGDQSCFSLTTNSCQIAELYLGLDE